MSISLKKELFIEFGDKNLIFLVAEFKQNDEINILDKRILAIEEIKDGHILNLTNIINIIQKSLNDIEKKIDFIFKNINVITNLKDYECTNVSGFKKLNNSQINKDDISFILNNIKSAIFKNEVNKSIIHIFNSKFNLDKVEMDNLPIGLFGNFYSHQLTFFLLNNNDVKNIKQIFNKCNLNVSRIILKSFAQGMSLINNNNNLETFFNIDLRKNFSQISYFEKHSYRYSQKFKFGTEIIINDISKVCSLSQNKVNLLLKEINFSVSFNDNEYLDKKYFDENKFRKVRLNLIREVISARIREIIDIFLFKNTNLKNFINNKKVFINIEDEIFKINLKHILLENFEDLIEPTINFQTQDELFNSCISSAELIFRGWSKEALPIIQTKKSAISRIFSSIFD